jgi:hypothetical protein
VAAWDSQDQAPDFGFLGFAIILTAPNTVFATVTCSLGSFEFVLEGPFELHHDHVIQDQFMLE